MTELHDDLVTVLDAVEIHSDRRFAVLGLRRDLEDGGLKPVDALASVLYERLYTRSAARHWLAVTRLRDRRDFVAVLSAANVGRGWWQAGWTIRRVEADGRVFVERHGVAFDDLTSSVRADGDAIAAGASCRVLVPKERRGAMPGFYVADGDAGDSPEGEAEIVRDYWHLRPEAAAPFLAAATSLLNEAGIPFQIKVLADPGAYRRADAGVLYLDRRDRERAGPIIAGIYAQVASALRADVPLFTKRLAPGLGYAEDPAGEMSFGQHRCHLIAGAIWDSFRSSQADRQGRALAIVAAFRREGLDPSRPHLGPGSSLERDPQPPAVTATVPVATPSVSLLEAAARIGRSLCRSAYRDDRGGLCNWMGRSIPDGLDPDAPIPPTASALGPGVYDGSAGTALFLGHLFAATGDVEVRGTALAAIRRSIRRLDRPTRSGATSPLSLHSGALGIAFAGRIIAVLIGDPGLDAEACSVLDRILERPELPRSPDLLDGIAGAIPALLATGRGPGLERCLSLAVRLGEELVRRAIRRDGSCAWPSDEELGVEMTSRPLTGLSHGAAGIGLALFELFATTGREDFLETARGAFAYEDSLFDARRANWPDLRLIGSSDRPDPGDDFAVAWCHGAPGIALTRLRAARLDRDRSDDYLHSARIAIATTLEAIDGQVEESDADATPCHGLAGLIEIAWTAGRMLDEPSWCARALAAAEVLIAQHAASDDWPSGAPSGGPNPSLMIGTAGIGYTFLRLHDPETVPSILLLTP
jgi:hypothetical protein